MKNMQQIMKQAQKMQKDLERAREDLKSARVEGSAGGGAVRVEVDGDGKVLAIRIQPETLGGKDPGMIEDLVLAAARDAQTKATALREERIGRVSGGLNLPGLF